MIRYVQRPIRLDYTVTPGHAMSRFLRQIAEGRIVGQRCPRCAKVYVPPRGSCGLCGVPTEEEVELSGKGTVTTFCIVNIPFAGQAVEIPYACASVLLDGADLTLFSVVGECPVSDVRMGMRVEAVWSDELKPTLESITHFRPIDEPDVPYDVVKEHM